MLNGTPFVLGVRNTLLEREKGEVEGRHEEKLGIGADTGGGSVDCTQKSSFIRRRQSRFQ